MNIVIERKIDENTKEQFNFWVSGSILYLDVYIVLKRKSPKHKFITEKAYSRLDHSQSYLWDRKKIKAEDVPLTDEIKKQAKDQFISKVKVDIWTEDSWRAV